MNESSNHESPLSPATGEVASNSSATSERPRHSPRSRKFEFTDPESRLAWHNSTERRWYVRILPPIYLLSLALSLLTGWGFYIQGHAERRNDLLGSFQEFFFAYTLEGFIFGTIFGIITPLLLTSLYGRQRSLFRDRYTLEVQRRKLVAAEANAGRSVESSTGISLASLWELNQNRLDYYHGMATSHARQSFRNAQLAMAVGITILTIASISAFIADNQTTTIVLGALGGVGTAISAFVANTFVRTQETSAAHMRAYFAQPLEFSKYLAAERLVHLASDSAKDELIGHIVRGMLNASFVQTSESE